LAKPKFENFILILCDCKKRGRNIQHFSLESQIVCGFCVHEVRSLILTSNQGGQKL
jgi:hypothetical protein